MEGKGWQPCFLQFLYSWWFNIFSHLGAGDTPKLLVTRHSPHLPERQRSKDTFHRGKVLPRTKYLGSWLVFLSPPELSHWISRIGNFVIGALLLLTSPHFNYSPRLLLVLLPERGRNLLHKSFPSPFGSSAITVFFSLRLPLRLSQQWPPKCQGVARWGLHSLMVLKSHDLDKHVALSNVENCCIANMGDNNCELQLFKMQSSLWWYVSLSTHLRQQILDKMSYMWGHLSQ